MIAIIAILASMLLPAPSKARAAAQGIKCKSNLKQIGTMWFFYANDNQDNVLPPYVENDHVAWGPWQEELLNQYYGQSHCVIDAPTVFACPSDAGHRAWFYTCLGLGYGYNPYVGDNSVTWGGYLPNGTARSLKSMSMMAAKNPTEILIVGDAWKFWWAHNPTQSFFSGIILKQDEISAGKVGNNNYAAHSDGMNVMWGDGHVAATADQNYKLDNW